MATNEDLKEQGNALFTAGKYAEAADVYTQAIAAAGAPSTSTATLFSNRSAAYLQLKDYTKALQDSEQAVKLRGTWDKAHWRHGAALEALGRYEEALKAFTRGAKANPSNEVIKGRAAAVRAKLRELERERYVADQKQARQRAREYGVGVRTDREKMTAATAASNNVATTMSFGPGGINVSADMSTRDARAAALGPDGKPIPDGWARGLGERQYGWLVDSYRMRVDDDNVHGGGNRHGLNDPKADKATVLEDFLVYCKMAVAAGAVPSEGWDWAKLADAAAELLPRHFAKADAIQKYGSENYFDGKMGMGSCRSLRHTAEFVLGISLHGEGPLTAARRLKKLQERSVGQWAALKEKPGTFFDDVGGVDAWLRLEGAMRPLQRR